MKINPTITAARVAEAVRRSHLTLDNPGFCIKCGAEAEGVEPDAQGYECETCDEAGVYGADELLFMMPV
jgi:hypothetical protein